MIRLQSFRRDLVHAVRTLARERAFTLVCVVSLGIGMGAVVALATLGRTITAPARGVTSEGLVEVLVVPQGPLREKAGVWALERWSYPDYRAMRDGDVGMDVTGWSLESSEFGEPTPEQKTPPRVSTLYVSPNYFRTFGVPLVRGTGFDASRDDAPSADPKVVLSYDFWTSRLASNPDIVGTAVLVDGVPHTVVGIAPPDFRGHFHFFQAPPSLLFVPLEQHPRLRLGLATTAGATAAAGPVFYYVTATTAPRAAARATPAPTGSVAAGCSPCSGTRSSRCILSSATTGSSPRSTSRAPARSRRARQASARPTARP